MKIFCYGDSNTYGWDPRGFFGGRYDRTWTDILAEAGHEVSVDAMPGRQIPFRKRPLDIMCEQFTEHCDLLIIMMGSNDIDATMNVEMVEARMETLLKTVTGWQVADRILLLGPPENRVTREHIALSHEMNDAFAVLAQRFGIEYTDTSGWDLVLAHDRCHLTAEDQETFARELVKVI